MLKTIVRNRLVYRLFFRVAPVSAARASGVKIGYGCRLQSSLFGSEPYLVALGDYVSVGAGVQFVTHDGAVWVLRRTLNDPELDLFGRITVGSNVFIGNGAILLPGVTVGDNVIIGAAAVVARDVPSGAVVAGVPARVISSVDEYGAKRLPFCTRTKSLAPSEKETQIKARFKD